MCLSTVYLVKAAEGEAKPAKELLCKNIAEVLAEGSTLRFIDVMGIPTTIRGTITGINLVDNYIEVSATE